MCATSLRHIPLGGSVELCPVGEVSGDQEQAESLARTLRRSPYSSGFCFMYSSSSTSPAFRFGGRTLSSDDDRSCRIPSDSSCSGVSSSNSASSSPGASSSSSSSSEVAISCIASSSEGSMSCCPFRDGMVAVGGRSTASDNSLSLCSRSSIEVGRAPSMSEECPLLIDMRSVGRGCGERSVGPAAERGVSKISPAVNVAQG